LSLVAASLVLVGMTAACGDDGETSSSDEKGSGSTSGATLATADEEEFCTKIITTGQAEQTGDLKTAQDAWKELYEVGVPKDIPADAREGYLWYYELLTTATDPSAAAEKAQKDTEGQADFVKFQEYVTTTCQKYAPTPTPAPSAPSPQPSS
jgi:hypothetical protein